MNNVDAVKTQNDIDRVERVLRVNSGDIHGDIWKLGINFALRVSDLLALTFKEVENDYLVVI